jgi:hypothetical protein
VTKQFFDDQRALYFPKTPAAKKQLQGELNELKALAPRLDLSRCDEAFLKLETVADFHDATLLLFRGVDIGFEPIAGALSGFVHPTRVATIKRLQNNDSRPHVPRGKGWVVRIADNPASIARAAKELLSCKDWHSDLTLDLSAIEAGERTTTLETAFQGLCRLLSIRAGRLLSRTDIADAVAWLALAADARADVQVGYGSSGWGHFLKREADRQDLERCAPEDYRLTHSFRCHVTPTAEDLTRLALAGHRIINAAECARRCPSFAGVGPSGAILLPNHGYASSAFLDGTGLADADLWRAMRLLSRAMYRATMLPLDAGLQSSWTEQRRFHRGFGVSCTTPTKDARNHALHGAIQMAQELKAQHPLNATYLEGNSLDRIEFADNGITALLSCETENIGDAVQFVQGNWRKLTLAAFQLSA